MHRASDTLSDPDRNLAESAPQTSSTPLPDTQDLDLISEETTEILRIHTPPPRIAARFYRPTTNRRKSSAASSRRNSVSSAASHQSSSRHGGPQSSFVAHHLRRASILEDRKARLADRAAHAEKVRLRAALSKAAPRSATNSEERALAAQQAREKNLAEIVAACAEEVKRAKGIAESMKEKREAEGKKLRRDMEERLAEAERRREEILNRNNLNKRGRSMSQARKSASPTHEVREAISEATAASRIQQKWRIHKRRKAVQEFATLGLTVDSVRTADFETVADLLAREKVLINTAQVLRICGLEEGKPGSIDEMTAVRTFLSSFAIMGHPTQVLSGRGDVRSAEQVQVGVLPLQSNDTANSQLQDLVAKARDLLISFENVLSRLNAANGFTPPPDQRVTVSEAYATFYNAFIAWKARDSSTMIDMMVLQFVELDSIWQSVKDSTEEAVTDSYRDGIRENQLKLMVRIKKLAGPVRGKKLIANAIREARKSRGAKKSVGDARPRAAESVEPEQRAADISVAQKTVATHLQPLTPPSTPRAHHQSPSQADELRITRPILPPNRVLTHEIAINKEYRIEEDALEERNMLLQAVFDSMRQEIAAGNSDIWILAMAENIRSRLQQLLKEGNSMYKLIGEALDHDVVARELQRGSFSYEKFFAFMASLLPKLCAPFRDAQMKEIVESKMQTGDIVSRLQALMHGIDLMQLDYANFMLSQAAPALVKNATSYETSAFNQMLAENNGELTLAENAWRDARTKVATELARRNPENMSTSRNQPTPERIYSQLLIDIFTTSVAIPETLQLDKKRITRIRTDVLRIVTSGAILLQCKNLLKRDVRSQWKTEAARIYTVLETAKTSSTAIDGIQAALESSRSMPVATKNHIRGFVTAVVTPFMSGEKEVSQPVARVLMVRLRGHILGRIGAGSEKEKVKSVSMASEGLATLGLPEWVAKIGAMVEEIGKVGALDREAHAGAYESIATKVEAEIKAAAAAAAASTTQEEVVDEVMLD